MLKDITIGQHFPGNSVVHKMDPRLKIVLIIAYIVVLFMSTNIPGLLLCGLCAFFPLQSGKSACKNACKKHKTFIAFDFLYGCLEFVLYNRSGRPTCFFLET